MSDPLVFFLLPVAVSGLVIAFIVRAERDRYRVQRDEYIRLYSQASTREEKGMDEARRLQDTTNLWLSLARKESQSLKDELADLRSRIEALLAPKDPFMTIRYTLRVEAIDRTLDADPPPADAPDGPPADPTPAVLNPTALEQLKVGEVCYLELTNVAPAA